MLLFIQVVEDHLMYAVIESGGKQYKVAPGEVVRVEKLSQESGATVEFNKVLAVYNDQEIMVGTPWVQNAKVSERSWITERPRKLSCSSTKGRNSIV